MGKPIRTSNHAESIWSGARVLVRGAVGKTTPGVNNTHLHCQQSHWAPDGRSEVLLQPSHHERVEEELWAEKQTGKPGFPGSSVGKESTCNVGDPGSIPGSGRSAGEGLGYPLQDSWASPVAQLVKSLPAMQKTWLWSLSWEDPREEKGYSLQHSGLKNSMDYIVHGVPKSLTWLSDFHLPSDLLRDFHLLPYFHLGSLNFPGGSDAKESACNAGNPSSIPGSEDPLEEEMATHSSNLA